MVFPFLERLGCFKGAGLVEEMVMHTGAGAFQVPCTAAGNKTSETPYRRRVCQSKSC